MIRAAQFAAALLLTTSVLPAQGQMSLAEVARRNAAVTLPVVTAKEIPARNPKIDAALLDQAAQAPATKGLGADRARSFAAAEIKASRTATAEGLKKLIEAQGGSVTKIYQNSVFATIPAQAFSKLAAAGEVYSVSSQPVFQPMQIPEATVSKGPDIVRAVGVARLHQAGLRGRGVRVGILDFGFLDYKRFEATGRLPKPAGERAFTDSGRLDQPARGDSHGTACAEIIHDLAPDAQIYLAAVDGRMDQIMSAADWLVSQHVQIINFAAATNLGPHDGRAQMDRYIDSLTRQSHVLWINSVGNEAVSHWTGDAAAHDAEGWVRIGKDTEKRLFIRADRTAMGITVIWDDWGPDPLHPTSTQSVDAYLYRLRSNEGGAEAVASRLFSPGRLAPAAQFNMTAETGDIFILALKAPQVRRPLRVHVFVGGGHVYPAMAERSVAIPATSLTALSVGAVNLRTGFLEEYSSRGPTEDGRPKPELSAYDAMQSLVYAHGFSGTSASCPTVTGVAVLLQQKRPDLSGLALREELLRYVRTPPRPPAHIVLSSTDYGRGIIDAALLAGGSDAKSVPPEGQADPAGKALDIALPDVLGGALPAAAMDRILAGASGLRAFDAHIAADQPGDVPFYHYDDRVRLTYGCEVSCYYAILHRDSAGVYSMIKSGELALEAGREYPLPDKGDGWYLKAEPPAGREQFILLGAAEPLQRGDLTSAAGWNGKKVSVSVAAFEVGP
jgi:hypothetical protein